MSTDKKEQRMMEKIERAVWNGQCRDTYNKKYVYVNVKMFFLQLAVINSRL